MEKGKKAIVITRFSVSFGFPLWLEVFLAVMLLSALQFPVSPPSSSSNLLCSPFLSHGVIVSVGGDM